jgi:hypothetical protein
MARRSRVDTTIAEYEAEIANMKLRIAWISEVITRLKTTHSYTRRRPKPRAVPDVKEAG